MIKFELISTTTVKLITNETIILRDIIDKYSVVFFRPDRFGKIRRDVRSIITVLGTFPIGLFVSIYRDIKKISDAYVSEGKFQQQEFIVDKLILQNIYPLKDYNIGQALNLPNTKYKYFDDQLTIINKVIKIGRGLIVSPCASGKSASIAGILHTLSNNEKFCNLNPGIFLISVPTRQLVEQMYTDFIEYGLTNVTRFSSNVEMDLSKKIIISNRSWLNIHSSELQNVSVLINDEVQNNSPDSVSTRYIRLLPTKFKIGLTATLPTNEYSRLFITGIFGEKLIDYKFLELERLRNNLSVNIRTLEFKYRTNDPVIKEIYRTKCDPKTMKINPSEKYKGEIDHFFFGNNSFVINNLVNFLLELHGNTIVIFDFLKIRDVILSLSTIKNNDRIHFIDGSVPIDDRENIRRIFENTTDQVLFAQSQTIGVGINIKNINNIVFLFTSKIQEKIIQAIGRGLRTTENKDSINIYDVISNLRYFKKHFSYRCKIYEENFGILPSPLKIINVTQLQHIDRFDI